MKNFKIEEKQWVLKTQTFYCMKKLLQYIESQQTPILQAHPKTLDRARL